MEKTVVKNVTIIVTRPSDVTELQESATADVNQDGQGSLVMIVSFDNGNIHLEDNIYYLHTLWNSGPTTIYLSLNRVITLHFLTLVTSYFNVHFKYFDLSIVRFHIVNALIVNVNDIYLKSIYIETDYSLWTIVLWNKLYTKMWNKLCQHFVWSRDWRL